MNNNFDKEATSLFLERYKHLEDLITNNNMYLIKKYYNNDYELFRSLRNILAHETINNDYPFIISKDVLWSINRLISILETQAINCSVKMENLFKANINTSLHYILKGMVEHHFSHVPLVDKNNIYVDMVTERTFTELLWLDPSKTLLYKPMGDILKTYQLTKPNVIFVAPNTTKLSLQDAFLKGYYDKRKLDAIFITQGGDSQKPILGMMTRGDVLIN